MTNASLVNKIVNNFYISNTTRSNDMNILTECANLLSKGNYLRRRGCYHKKETMLFVANQICASSRRKDKAEAGKK